MHKQFKNPHQQHLRDIGPMVSREGREIPNEVEKNVVNTFLTNQDRQNVSTTSRENREGQLTRNVRMTELEYEAFQRAKKFKKVLLEYLAVKRDYYREMETASELGVYDPDDENRVREPRYYRMRKVLYENMRKTIKYEMEQNKISEDGIRKLKDKVHYTQYSIREWRDVYEEY